MKIKKLHEDVQHCWFGYYLDRNKEKKYFYMTKDAAGHDPDEASDYMEDSIPEPFTKFVFCGSIASTQAEKQGYKLVEAKQVKVFGAKAKKLNESVPTQSTLDDCLQDYKENAFGFDGVEDYVETNYPSHPQDFKDAIVKYLKGKNESLTEETQYGVHSFSQDAIIFRGTEEECGRYIDSHKELWDDAEVYRMEPGDPHYKKMNEAANYKVKFFQVFEAPKSPTENGKMIGQRGTLDAANAFGKERAGEGNYIIKAVCDDGKTRNIDNDADPSAYTLVEAIEVATIADYITDHYEFDDIDDKYSCINSIRDSFKDDKTISWEELEQFIGAHSGRDKVEETLTEDKGQPRGKRYTTYFNRIKRAIEKGDEETLQRTKEAIMYAPAKELKNSEASELMDMIKNRKINEASYGGAFDIADDQYFTRDDLNSFADEVLGHVSETFNGLYDIGGVWFEDGHVITLIVDDSGNEYEDKTKVDMRRIREPWHLKRMYAFPVAANIIKQIEENNSDVVTENIQGMGEYSDKFYAYLEFLQNEGNQDNIAYLASQLIRYCKDEDLKDLWFDRMNKVAKVNGFGDSINEALNTGCKHVNSLVAGDVIEDDGVKMTVKSIKKQPNCIEVTFDDDSTASYDHTEEVKVLVEGVMDELHKAQRYLDFEIPDTCRTIADKLPDMTEQDMLSINKHCMKFKDVLDYYSTKVSRTDEELEERFDGETHKVVAVAFDVIAPVEMTESEIEVELTDAVNKSRVEVSGGYMEIHTLDEALKEALKEDVAVPVLEGPKEGPENGIAVMLNSALQDELKTIQMYNDYALNARAEGFDEVASQIDEINTEENKHVGQLQRLLKTVSPNAQAMDAGELEAEDALTEQKKKPTFLERKWGALGVNGKTMYLTDNQLKELKDAHKDYEFTETTPLNTIPKNQKAYVAKKVEEGINNSDNIPNTNNDSNVLEEDAVDRAQEIYNRFKTIEKELNNDGEAVTAVIDKLYNDNKQDPDYKKAYDRWASGE